MRILLIAPQPFFSQRGTPINVRQMVQTLCEAGHEVHLATYSIGEPVSIPGLRIHRALPIPGVRRVPIGFSWRKVALDGLLALTTWRLIAGKRFDVVHAIEESVFFALPSARLRRIPVIYDLDSWLSDQLAYGGRLRNGAILSFVRRMKRAALRRSRLAITVSASLSDAVHAMEPNVPIAQIEDCPLDEALRAPDHARIASLRASYSLGDRRAVVYTGNLESYQGIGLLLDAFALVAQARTDAVLVLVGGSPAQAAAVRARAAAPSGANRAGSASTSRIPLANPSAVAGRSTATLASSTCVCVGKSVATIGTADHMYEYSLSGVLPPCSRGDTSTSPIAIHSGISSAGR